MSRYRISTPTGLADLAERAFTQGPLGDLAPAPDAPLPASRGGIAASVPWAWFRDLVVGTASAGGNTVAGTTPFVGAQATLRGYSVLVDSGCSVTDVGPGTAEIAVAATPAVHEWVAEGAADTSTDMTFGAPIALTPRTLRVSAKASRRLLKTSPVAERMLMAELLLACGRALDAAVLNAGGSAVPVGLAGTSGRITQSGTSLSWATVADVERQVLAAGVRAERLRYITDPQVRELLTTRERAAGSLHIIESDKIGAVPVAYSNDGPANAALLGDWSLAHVVFYGGRPALLVNPFKYGTSGLVEFTLHAEVGIGFPKPGAFAHIDSIT